MSAAPNEVDGAVRRHGGAGRRRSVARLAAVQALYQLELDPGRGVEAVIGEFVHHRLGREIDGECYGEADATLFADIVGGTAANRERLDEAVAAALSEEWPLPRLETVLRVILAAGAFELMCRPDIPPRVTMSEYVGIAYAFFAGKEPGLANGVLNCLARRLRAAEL